MVWIRFLIPGGYLYPLKPRGNHIQTMARSRQQPFQVQAPPSRIPISLITVYVLRLQAYLNVLN